MAVRLVVAAATDGVAFDVESMRIVRDALGEHGLDLYGAVNSPAGYRWPYPPAFLGWIAVCDALARGLGGGYVTLVQLAPIAADGALAWVVHAYLGLRGAGARTRLLGAGLVALGPSFALISGYAVQVDSVAILPAAAALLVWERGAPPGRAWRAGLLIGAAAAVKTVPALLVLALLPSARGWREGARLVVAAAAVPALLLAPFALADADGVREMLRYHGVPGVGGLTLALQPELAEAWLRAPVPFNGANEWLAGHQREVNLALVAAVGAFLLAFRVPPARAAAILWLAVWAFGTGFFFQYLVWGLPFLIMAGHLRAAAVLQAVSLVPAVLLYAGPWESSGVVAVFVACMLALWVGWLAGLVALGRRAVHARGAVGYEAAGERGAAAP